MDRASRADKGLITNDNDVSPPLLEVRRLRGNARCARCKDSGREDCYLERRKAGRHRCLTCTSDEECQFRRIVVKESPAFSFTWDELIQDDTATTDTAAGSDVIKDDRHSNRKRQRQRSPVVDASHSHDAADTGSAWLESDLTLASLGQWTKSSVADNHRGLLAPELMRLCQTFTKEQTRLIEDLYRRHSRTTNRTTCVLKAMFDATNKKHHHQRHYDGTSLASEPASQVRTNISWTPFKQPETPAFTTNYPPPDEENPFGLLSSGVDFNDVLNAGDWAVPVNDYLQPLYLAGSTSVTDRQSSVIHDLSDASTQFGGSSWVPSGYSSRSLFESAMPSTLDLQSNTRSTATMSKLGTDSVSDLPDALPFKCAHCGDLLNTRSEFRKHTARHTKPFVCTVEGCLKATDGFATRNDLDRHIASIHDTTHAFRMYQCAVPGCKDPTKIWARKDNFKAHIKRMHPEADLDLYLEKSVVEPRDLSKEEG